MTDDRDRSRRVPPLPDPVADELLEGRVPADALPPEYRGVHRVLAAATAPPRTAEPEQEGSARELFASVRRGTTNVDTGPKRRRTRPLVLIAAAVAVVVGISVAGAATGSLPDPVQDLAHDLFGDLGVPAAEGTTADDSVGTGGDDPSDGRLGGEAADREPRTQPGARSQGNTTGNGPPADPGPPANPGNGNGPPPDPGNGNGPPTDPGPPANPGNGNGPPADPGNGPPANPGNGNGPPANPGNGNGPPADPGNGNGPPADPGNGNGPPADHGPPADPGKGKGHGPPL